MEITVKTLDGDRQIEAPYTIGKWAVHPITTRDGFGDQWTITYIPNGYAFVSRETRKAALFTAVEMHELDPDVIGILERTAAQNRTESDKAVMAQIKIIRDKYDDEFEDVE